MEANPKSINKRFLAQLSRGMVYGKWWGLCYSSSSGDEAEDPPSMASGEKKKGNFMRQFRNETNQLNSITASQLLAIWEHYDIDGSGYLEGEEIDQFLKEFVSSVCREDVGADVISDSMFLQMKQDFMDAYDDNEDGRIELRELAMILPTDENFLLLFQLENRVASGIDFMKIWRKYDKDSNGFIDRNELKEFLRDLIQACHSDREVPSDKLEEYAQAVLVAFDSNRDGMLQLSEMARLVPVKENVISAAFSKPYLQQSNPFDPFDVEKVFDIYDLNRNQTLEGDELTGFARDFLAMLKPNHGVKDLEDFEKFLLNSCDLDGDGKLSRDELSLMIRGLQRYLTQ